MFDSYTIRALPAYPQNIKVEEYRAPTDASIKLYGEMLDKARASYVETFEVQNNLFNFVVAVFRDHFSAKYICRYKYKLNGDEFEDEIVVSGLDDVYKNKYDIAKAIYEKMAPRLAAEISKAALKSLMTENPVHSEEFYEDLK